MDVMTTRPRGDVMRAVGHSLKFTAYQQLAKFIFHKNIFLPAKEGTQLSEKCRTVLKFKKWRVIVSISSFDIVYE